MKCFCQNGQSVELILIEIHELEDMINKLPLRFHNDDTKPIIDQIDKIRSMFTGVETTNE